MLIQFVLHGGVEVLALIAGPDRPISRTRFAGRTKLAGLAVERRDGAAVVAGLRLTSVHRRQIGSRIQVLSRPDGGWGCTLKCRVRHEGAGAAPDRICSTHLERKHRAQFPVMTPTGCLQARVAP